MNEFPSNVEKFYQEMTFISVEIHILEIELLEGRRAAKWIVWSQHWEAEERGAPHEEACQSIATALGRGEGSLCICYPQAFPQSWYLSVAQCWSWSAEELDIFYFGHFSQKNYETPTLT